MQRAQHFLESVFGYRAFRNHQAEIIRTLLEGRDALALMPTGGGKSLCYQIPALVRAGTGVIVSPLIALMQDQVDALTQLGIRAAYLNSTLDSGQQWRIENQLLAGELDLLYVAPERLVNERTLQLLKQIQVALFAIDEAHCVSQWGHDFRKEYQQLSVLYQRFPEVPRIALTATADPRTRQEIITQLGLEQAEVFVNSFDRPNIRYAISEGRNAREQLWRFLEREHPHDAGIVYCLARKSVDAVADWLNAKGRRALPYHAGLPDAMRQDHQQRFLREEGVIVVATIAFGMGIDKPDVRFVAHLNLPKSVEAYYQETGRAGRDGQPANAWMAYQLGDVITLRGLMDASDAEEQHKRVTRHKLDAMLGLCEMTSCRRQALLGYFGETLAKPCGNCDNCLHPPETWDGSEVARKALSCVYRTGQRFGVNYVIDVLTGKVDERIQRNAHDHLSTFGLGQELAHEDWRGVFRQLIALGYLDVDHEGYGALRLTERCRPLLRGETQLALRRQARAEKTRAEKKPKAERDALRACDETLFDALRTLRRRLAEEQGVPPYVIFSDATLQELARIRPASSADLRAISGIGDYKLERYGVDFLAVIRQHPLPGLLDNDLSETVNATLALHLAGHTAEAIAAQRGLKPITIQAHFAAAIGAGLVKLRDVIALDDTQYHEIRQALKLFDLDDDAPLQPVYEALEGAYDYGVLRCVRAEMARGRSA
ncbi:MAG: DNA helicase RecQ [Thiotrichales bacterium]